MTNLRTYFSVTIGRWFAALAMLGVHRRTLVYLARQGWWRNAYNHIFTTFFIRGEDCGKGVLDPVWQVTGRAPFGWDIEVEVTTKCYLRCIHCEQPRFLAEYKQHLTFKAFKRLIDGIPSLKWINLTGEGSAFLNPHFLQMVQYVKSKGIYLDFSHDFYRLSVPEMKALVRLGVDRVFWSVDGATKRTYEKVRVGSSWDDVICNVRELIKVKRQMRSPLPELCVRYTFFRDNVREVTQLLPLLHRIAPADDWGDEPSVNLVALLDFAETQDLIAEVPPADVQVVNDQAKRLGWQVYWSHVTHEEEKKPPLHWCTFWSEPYVMITGHVVPCCGVLMSNRRPFLEQHAFGNVNKQSLREIWDTPRYRRFRKMVTSSRSPVPVQCLGCRVFNTTDRYNKYGRAE